MKLSLAFSSLLALIPLATAQQGPWQQCGGIGWSGGTTCAAGWVCIYQNDWYSQCLQDTNPVTPTPSSSSSSSSVPPTSTTSSTPPSATGLNDVAVSKGKLYIGTATEMYKLNADAPYAAIASDIKEFGMITAENSMKWDATERTQGVWTFTGGDNLVNWAIANGQKLRGHTTVWHSQLPSWVGKYVHSWDVVNEPFNDDGTFRSSVFYTTLGTSYIATALHAARAADPDAKLYINDYNIDGLGAKSTAMANLVAQLKADNVPIDGIGIQGHLIVGAVPNNLQANFEQFAALGVEIAITELDIRMTLPVTPEKLAQQKADYKKVVAACNAVPACVGITVWEYTDKYSWVPGVFTSQGAALPWDDNLAKKPAYDGIVEGFN
ncbi:Beta-xylanase [Pleurotus pulmonarius]